MFLNLRVRFHVVYYIHLVSCYRCYLNAEKMKETSDGIRLGGMGGLGVSMHFDYCILYYIMVCYRNRKKEEGTSHKVVVGG